MVPPTRSFWGVFDVATLSKPVPLTAMTIHAEFTLQICGPERIPEGDLEIEDRPNLSILPEASRCTKRWMSLDLYGCEVEGDTGVGFTSPHHPCRVSTTPQRCLTHSRLFACLGPPDFLCTWSSHSSARQTTCHVDDSVL